MPIRALKGEVRVQITVYTVQSLAEGKSSLAGLDHFDLKREKSLPADALLTTPNLSLYSFDDELRCAIFVETSPEIDLTAAPFYYRDQKSHARRVFTVPYEIFNALAEKLPDPAHLVLLHSVGRCGSTLLCHALGKVGNIVSLSEPDTYTCAVGMRPPDGSRDAELTELLRSATRFLSFHTPAVGEGVLLLKFRAWCLEVADLLHQACPDAQALFLSRDLEGWIRSMGRLLKVTDPERDALYRRQGVSTPMFIFPRDRFVSLLRHSPFVPETWLEDVTLGWVSLMVRYGELYRQGVVTHALTYDDLVRQPQPALQAVATACGISASDFSAALAVFEHDSQAGTRLSGRMLRERKDGELSVDDVKRAEAVALRHGLEPHLTKSLPGNLLSG